MHKRSSTTTDINLIAASIVDAATSDKPTKTPTMPDGKNAAAVLLGRRGGLIGGKARAKILSPRKRKAIAKRAALARWGAEKS